MGDKIFTVLLAIISVVATILFMVFFKDVFAKAKVGLETRAKAPAISKMERAPTISDGNGKYELTKLGWLALHEGLILHHHVTREEPFKLDILAFNEDNILCIQVLAESGCKKEIVMKHIDDARQHITALTKNLGWDSWITIKDLIVSADGATSTL